MDLGDSTNIEVQGHARWKTPGWSISLKWSKSLDEKDRHKSDTQKGTTAGGCDPSPVSILAVSET